MGKREGREGGVGGRKGGREKGGRWDQVINDKHTTIDQQMPSPHLQSMKLTDDGLVLCIVAGEVGEDTRRAGDHVHVLRGQQHDQLSKQVIQVVLA